jgi:spoIIIJ-associated protein
MIDKKEIQEIVKKFFSKMGFSNIEMNLANEEDNVIFLDIKTDEPKILIGQNGQTLNDIQQLLKAIIKHKTGFNDFYLNIDINDYKKKKAEYLKEMARYLADEVSLSKQEKILEPMSPYERRIIHLELLKREDIKTESIGEGKERRVVIKPKF